LQRFICRRGGVKLIRSDNGTNFVGGERELREAINALDQATIRQRLLSQEIEWKFNTPGASHMGGVWERMIRSTRKVLQALMREQTMDDEGLSTVLCQAESIVNSRPITYVSDDAQDAMPLTPNHLLQLRAPTVFPVGSFDERDLYARRRWRQVVYMSEIFWLRWKKRVSSCSANSAQVATCLSQRQGRRRRSAAG
jgi:hypothetical protein